MRFLPKRTLIGVGLAAVLLLSAPVAANAVTWYFYTGPYPSNPTDLAQGQVATSAVTYNAGGRGITHSTFGASFRIYTQRDDASRQVVGSAEVGGGTWVQYTHVGSYNTFVGCYWGYWTAISGVVSTECARGY